MQRAGAFGFLSDAPVRLRGILLAAGSSRRFGANKLLHPLPGPAGAAPVPVALASARQLLAVLPDTLAVLRPGADQLAAILSAAGCSTTVCVQADAGMGCSLAHAIGQSAGYDGWVIALADMPFLRPASIAAVAGALADGAAIVLPTWQGEKGHPVGFAKEFGADLARLTGDAGARSIVQAHPAAVRRLVLDDPGIVRDVDTPADLAGPCGPATAGGA